MIEHRIAEFVYVGWHLIKTATDTIFDTLLGYLVLSVCQKLYKRQGTML